MASLNKDVIYLIRLQGSKSTGISSRSARLGWATDSTLLTFSLLISEDFWLFLDFPSDRSIFSTVVGGRKTLRSLRKERKTQKSSLTSREKVHKVRKPWWASLVQTWGWCIFCSSLRFWQFVHHPLPPQKRPFAIGSSFVVVVYVGFPFLLSDNSIWGRCAQMLQMLWSQG